MVGFQLEMTVRQGDRMRRGNLRCPLSSSLLIAGVLGAGALAVATSPARAEQPRGLADALAREGVPALAAAAASGGDPARGAVLFHTAHLTCTKCHAADGGASPLGPDLAGPRIGPEGPLTGKALTEHLVAAVLDPSAWIGPHYRAVTIATTEGQTVTGLVARETASSIVLRDASSAGGEIEIARGDVEERIDLQTSLMPAGLANLLADRQQFLDLVKYLDEIAQGGPARARALQPDPALLAAQGPAAYEADIDHAGFIADWANARQAAAAFKRGEAIYVRVCANCHGTHTAPGSLPTAPRFAEGRFKAGADPHAMYRTLTSGAGQMVAQGWMVPSQKYDVIHYIREAYLKPHNPASYTAVTPDYLATLPTGTSRGPEPSKIEPWRIHDYGPFLAASIEAGGDGTNVARKGLAVRLDPGPGGIGRGHAWILYELDTLRATAVWTGDAFIDWRGINFDGSHGTHPRIVGDLLATTPALPGWADPATGSFADPRPLGRDGKPYGPLPPSHARFTALHHAGDAVVLEYRIGQQGIDARHAGTRVLETARLEPTAAAASAPASPIVTRIWSVAPHECELAVHVAAVARDAAETAVALVGSPVPGARLEIRDGCHTLVLPPSAAAATVGVAVAAGSGGLLEERARRLAPVEPLDRLVGTPARNPWTTPAPLETPVVRGAADGPFATDLLTPPVSNPWNAQLRLSGIDFLAADKAVVCTWDGDVWTVAGLGGDGGRLTWKRIASGLYQPLGIKVIDGAIHVGCRDRIVILRDLDGDGCTDRYDTFNSDHQVTEHFHEFAMGLETDAAGTVYYAKSARHALPAVVPHHGTLLAVAKDGSATEILATGFRAANGVCVEPDGTFFVTDQEGHWNPKNRINHVRRGGFYGNMFGYHDVTDASDAAMEQPLAWLTNAFDRSPAELVRVPPTAWPQLSGRLLELSYGEGRIHLVLPQEVPGRRPGDPPRLQGGLVALPMPDFPTGIMRGRFHAGDQALYTCGLFAWAGNKTAPGGLYRVRRTQAPLRMPVELSTSADGFAVTFASPLDRAKAGDPAAWRCRTWSLTRSAKYGSPHVGEQDRKITGVDISSDGHTAVVRIEDFGPSQCYELAWDLAAADGGPVAGRIHGTVHVAAAAPAAGAATTAGAAEIVVSPDGPIRSLAEAQQEAQRTKANVVLRSGTYHLPEPLVFTAEDSGTEYRAAPGEKVVISGGRPLVLKWEPFKDGIMRATTPRRTRSMFSHRRTSI
ncbi:MAG: heme-binding protein [Planctomycetia bacterium]|nr:heme-binding protein [Planctomycetia bacterium]